ncbi:phospholipase D family protein [Ammonifex thiophilus]|uniref:phospholipase D n=1 Tax=Ammonifex thiophilus TaxID=444093 RepID=A0A3D8P5B4_9THEO|nr:phospholipase D family protein [Ammonifex thiophilus]RDV84530.1 phospholipase D family protein [Ammonifex thiophilus]
MAFKSMRSKPKAFSLFLLLFLLLLASGCLSTGPTATGRLEEGSWALYFPRSGQDPAPALCSLIGQARSSCDVAIYSLTHPDIVKALVQAHKRGVKVRVITDKEWQRNDSQRHAVNVLLLAGIPVKENRHAGLMHLKMVVIDGEIVTTGSYNFTRSASEKNDEMFLVVKSAELSRACSREFERMWNDQVNFAPVTYRH